MCWSGLTREGETDGGEGKGRKSGRNEGYLYLQRITSAPNWRVISEFKTNKTESRTSRFRFRISRFRFKTIRIEDRG